ncbi:MAG: AmmeMemoRadiSam system radical SAM enzyme [Lentisphaeria bacterium]|nr:AmmeMemoRadiSam system radical SAM enzyme [Lentisphaeria bacterium]
MNLPEARWWTPQTDKTVRCELCPRHCLIADGACGYCGVRVNKCGVLYSQSYGRPVSIAVDPIEKKPLRHFMQGSRTLSFGTFGCNLGCIFCQNDSLSRGCYHDWHIYDETPPEELVDLAKQHHCPSISYTYNEPTVFAEYLIDIARVAHQHGLKNVLVSNGYISPEAASELYPLIDAANIDMKGFSETYYKEMCNASLEPVLDNLQRLYRLGVHLEITTLVIPDKNDSDDELLEWLKWVAENLDKQIPLHFSAYHPAYKCHIRPTPSATLYHIRDLANQHGFSNVHLGNIF